MCVKLTTTLDIGKHNNRTNRSQGSIIEEKIEIVIIVSAKKEWLPTSYLFAEARNVMSF